MMRTKEERQQEARTIIDKLTELKLTVMYEPIEQLFQLLKTYIHEGITVKIDIPFPSIRKRIVGKLPVDKSEECWVKLTQEKTHS